jgi:chromosome partitioning protein
MYILSVANEKGGVAKTTSTLSLGAVLAETQKVLLIDLDPLACLTMSAGVEVKDGQPTIAEVLLTQTPIDDAIVRTEMPGLDLIPSKKSLGKAEQYLWDHVQHIFVLKDQLLRLSGSYDYVLLDCPPFLGAITLSALVASTIVLVPTQAEYLGIMGMRDLINKINKVKSNANPQLIHRTFFTFFNARNKVNNSLHENLVNNFGDILLQTTIGMDTKVKESQIVGIPVTQYSPRCRASKQYRLLADEILNVLSVG